MKTQEYKPANERIRIISDSTNQSVPVRIAIVREGDVAAVDCESARPPQLAHPMPRS